MMIPRLLSAVSLAHFSYTSWHIYLSVCTLPSLSASLMFLAMPESAKFLCEVSILPCCFVRCLGKMKSRQGPVVM